MSLRPYQIMQIGKILRDFGKKCYWYGEETGDYDMKNLGLDILTEATVEIEKVIDAKH